MPRSCLRRRQYFLNPDLPAPRATQCRGTKVAPKACRSGAHPATRKCGKKGVAVVDQGSGVGFGPREARGQDLVIVTNAVGDCTKHCGKAPQAPTRRARLSDENRVWPTRLAISAPTFSTESVFSKKTNSVERFPVTNWATAHRCHISITMRTFFLNTL